MMKINSMESNWNTKMLADKNLKTLTVGGTRSLRVRGFPAAFRWMEKNLVLGKAPKSD